MSDKTKPVAELEEVSMMLAELSPEELEPRLELQVMIDPLIALAEVAANENVNKNINKNINKNG